MSKCWWIPYEDGDYYETECSNSIEKEDMDNICPTYCPWCGEEIEIEKD